jgi:hypothetical protein
LKANNDELQSPFEYKDRPTRKRCVCILDIRNMVSNVVCVSSSTAANNEVALRNRYVSIYGVSCILG